VTLFEHARSDLWTASSCLLAARRGDDSAEARVGSLLEAEQLALVRTLLGKK
jgi:hypothetical protein